MAVAAGTSGRAVSTGGHSVSPLLVTGSRPVPAVAGHVAPEGTSRPQLDADATRHRTTSLLTVQPRRDRRQGDVGSDEEAHPVIDEVVADWKRIRASIYFDGPSLIQTSSLGASQL